MRWAVVIIIALTLVRFMKGAGDPPYGVDASYYFQLARHVMNGEGLVTTVSLYHEGWVVPAKTAIYPLWPLTLGYAGRVIGLARAADLLPRLFYVIDLVLLYLLARAIASRLGGLALGRYLPDTAAVIVAIFGLVPRFFGATTHPYTEGMAFAMALAAFLALERFERTRGVAWAAVSGIFAGLAFLARTQMVWVAIGCFLALAWFCGAAAFRPPRDGGLKPAAPLVAWSLAALLTIAPWLLFLGFLPRVMESTLPRVTLPRFEGWTEFPSTSEWLRQRATSLGVMFNPRDPYSYVQSFGAVAFLVPLAGLAALLRRRFAAPRSVIVTAVFIAGLCFFFNLMLYHSAVWMPWLFGWRHGLPYIFLIVVAVPWLVARAGRFVWAVALVLLVSVLMNASNVAAFIRSPDPQLTRGETGLLQWLDAQPRPPRVMTTNAQILGGMSDAHFYWTYCDSPGATTRAIWSALRIDYVALYEHELQCRFAKEAGAMRLIDVFGEPRRRVFLLRPVR